MSQWGSNKWILNYIHQSILNSHLMNKLSIQLSKLINYIQLKTCANIAYWVKSWIARALTGSSLKIRCGGGATIRGNQTVPWRASRTSACWIWGTSWASWWASCANITNWIKSWIARALTCCSLKIRCGARAAVSWSKSIPSRASRASAYWIWWTSWAPSWACLIIIHTNKPVQTFPTK